MSKIKIIAKFHQGEIEITVPENRAIPYSKKLLANHKRELAKGIMKNKPKPFLNVEFQKIEE